MITNIEMLNWDSEFFGIKIGKLELNSDFSLDINNLNFSDFELIYVFSKEKVEFNNGGDRFFLADKKVTFEMNTSNSLLQSGDVIEYKSKLITDDLINLSLISGKYSRFNKDSRINEKKFQKLYKTWIIRSVKREICEIVFVKKINEKIIGFVTLAISNQIGVIGLISVDSDFQKMGIGKFLINACLIFLQDRGIEKIEVATQMENSNAVMFYEKCGFKIKEITNIYHFWTK